MVRIEVVITDHRLDEVIGMTESAGTGKIGNGKIFVIPVEEIIRIRTGERGPVAI